MALDDTALLIPGTGAILTNTTGTARPTVTQLGTFATAGTLPTTWTHLGHTSLDDILAPGQDGGDTEVKGSWQNKSLREIVTAQAVDYFVVKSLQILDNNILSLYYGGGDIATADEFGVPDSPVPTEKAVTIVFIDGTTPTAIYMPKASIRREDAMEFDAAEFTTAPLRLTALKNGTSKRMYWVGANLGA